MTAPDHQDICRLCLSVGSQTFPLITEENELYKGLITYLSLHISADDPYPKQICKECNDKIEDINNFKQKVLQNEKLLHNAYSKKNGLEKLYIKLKNVDYKTDDEALDSEITFDLNDSKTDIQENQDIKIKTSSPEIRLISRDDNFISSQKELESPQIKCEEVKIETDDDIQTNVTNTEIEQFKCLTCFHVFDAKNLLLNHYNSEHKPKNNTVAAKYVVINAEEDVEKYKCMQCERIFGSKKLATAHLREHDNEHAFLCKLCGRTYATASAIVRHSRAHYGARLACARGCGYSSAYRGALSQHERRHDRTDKYKCEECGKGFQVKTWFLQHQNIHKGLKPFVCDICGVAFHMDRYLTAHKGSVHPHTSDVKRYLCPHCYMPCDSRKAFTDHLKEHGVTKSYLCDICGKTLSSAEQLKFHKRVHLGVRPYACSTCNKTFTKKFNLQVHSRSHAAERVSCSRCPARYTQRSTLLRHANRHHTKCTKCLKSFPSAVQLDLHEKTCL